MLRRVALLGLIAGAYYGAAKLGLSLAFATSSVTAIWPPTGIALASLVLWGRSAWPGVAAGAFLANAWTGVPLLTVLGITAGNTLEAVVGASLLEWARFRPSLQRVRDVAMLAILAAAASTAVSATIGVLSLLAGDEVRASELPSVWRVWWLGDLGGDLLVAPVLLVAGARWPLARSFRRPAEAVILSAALIGAGLLIFRQELNVAYLVLPLLIWAVLRFSQGGATLGSLAVTAIAVAFTADDRGPFVRANPDESLLLAQTYFGVIAITMLTLAAVISERRRAEETTRHIARTLQESLLPPALPDIQGVEIGARFRPRGAANRVGGDFYDVFELAGDRWGIVVGDVWGKGPEAAAVTALARYTLREAAVHEPSPSGVLARLNDAIRRQRGGNEFCTAVYGRLELGGERASVTLSVGGHPLPIVLRADGSTEFAGRPGMALGLDPSPGLADEHVLLGPGDTLMIYTDGLTDAYAPARSMLPADIAALLRSLSVRRAGEIADGIYDAVLGQASGEPRDDVVILVVRLAG
jgi:integral membrane sensor domain MASE1